MIKTTCGFLETFPWQSMEACEQRKQITNSKKILALPESESYTLLVRKYIFKTIY